MASDFVNIGKLMVSHTGNLNGHDEGKLVRLAVDGDSEAFGALYVRHMDVIYRYIYFRISDEVEAEDLTEEVFIRAWEALPSYKPGEFPFTSWLYRIAHNLIIDYHRKRKPQILPDLEIHLTETVPSSEDNI